jgi:hypothetical protein
VKDTPLLPPARVRRAIVTCVFDCGGTQFDCTNDVEEATSLFLNRFADSYQWFAGGALSWDTIILTVGGSALLYPRVKSILKHQNVILADGIDALQLTNV